MKRFPPKKTEQMKKAVRRIGVLLLTLALLLPGITLLIPTATAAESDTVTLSSTGDLNAALASVKDGGTVRVSGTYTLPSGFSWQSHGKSVTITGGTLNASAVSALTLGDHVRLESMTLILKSGGTVYANGHSLYVDESVTVNNVATVFGGGAAGSTVASTDVTLLAGVYAKVYGGSNGGTVSGDTRLYVGGTVNATIDETDHGGTNNLFGGGVGDTIGGDTCLTVADRAKAHYVFGGSTGAGATIGGTARLTVTGGKMMSIYGGNNNADAGCDIHTLLLGGEAEQVFGGNQSASLTGNVTLRVLGGTFTRRIYGGCYNEVTRSGLSANWHSTNHVAGNITLVIGSGASIPLNYDGDDLTIYAKSRYKTKIDTGACQVVFSDPAAYTTYNRKLGAQDTTMQAVLSFFFGGTNSPADSVHTLTHTAAGGVITEACNTCSHTASATLSLDPAAALVYSGAAICPVTVSYDEGWLGETVNVTYENNVNAGEAVASCGYLRESTTVTLTFSIEKAFAAPPVLSGVDESVQGQSDGGILGLTPAMEYSVDGEHYRPVTDPALRLAPGTYWVRVAETHNTYASEAVSVTVGAGRQIIDPAALTVKYQLPKDDTAASETTCLRLISTVDHLGYERVGFRVWIENASGVMTEQELLETTSVYTSLVGTDGETVTTYTPAEEFCRTSAYFFTKNLIDVPQGYYDRLIRVQAYVVTADGYTVYGEAAEGRLRELLPAAEAGGVEEP